MLLAYQVSHGQANSWHELDWISLIRDTDDKKQIIKEEMDHARIAAEILCLATTQL